MERSRWYFMYRIDLLNKISKKGLNLFTEKYEHGTDISNPDGILVNKEMKDMTLPSSLKAIAGQAPASTIFPLTNVRRKALSFLIPRGPMPTGERAGYSGHDTGSTQCCRRHRLDQRLIGEGEQGARSDREEKQSLSAPRSRVKSLVWWVWEPLAPCWPMPPKASA